jgi:hypothetical protein
MEGGEALVKLRANQHVDPACWVTWVDEQPAMRQLRRTVNAVDDNPQALDFGNGSNRDQVTGFRQRRTHDEQRIKDSATRKQNCGRSIWPCSFLFLSVLVTGVVSTNRASVRCCMTFGPGIRHPGRHAQAPRLRAG